MPAATDADVRLLAPDELLAAATLVSSSMLGTTAPETMQAWVDHMDDRVTHGAVTPDGRVVGVAQWFREEVSFAGASRPAALVTAVAVASDQRRRGHLRRIMAAELASIAEAEVPLALLVAAEWPIYGRYGYGPAIEACGFELDARSADFVAPRTGSVELVTPQALLPHLQTAHQHRWARTAGAVTRRPFVFEHLAGCRSWPGDKEDLGQRRGAVWRDEAGTVQGAVGYAVEERWERNRPMGKAEVKLLVGATPEAERELWRHLCEIDWITSVVAGGRGVEDPLPHLLVDARAAVQVDRFDCIWARVLDVPSVLGARRSAIAGRVVIEVEDPLGYAAGRWSIELGPEGAEVAATTADPEVEMSIGALGALAFGGTSAVRLHHAGHVVEAAEGAVVRLEQLLRSSPAPWSPTTY